MARKLYRPICMACYSCYLTPAPVGKREADRVACSHMNAYKHQTAIIPATPDGKTPAQLVKP